MTLRNGVRRFLGPLALGLLVVLVYLGGVNNRPVAEDFFAPESMLTVQVGVNFRPVWALPLFGIQEVFGPQAENPRPYRIFSLVLHLVATWAVWCFARQLGLSAPATLVMAGVFALYPRHHESVFWPIGTSHALMTVFLLLSLISYLRSRQMASRRWFAVAVVLFTLGVFSSEDGAIGLMLIAVYEWIWRRAPSGQDLRAFALTLVRLLWPFALGVAIYAVVLALGEPDLGRLIGAYGDTQTFYHLSLSPRQLQDLAGYVSYTLVPFVPLRLVSDATKIGIFLATIAILTIALPRGPRLMRFGALWVITTVLPYVLLVHTGNSDRYFYLPSVGFALILVGGFAWAHATARRSSHALARRIVRIASLLAIGAYVLACVTLIQQRAHEWYIAGEQVERILTQIQTLQPTVTAGTTFYVLGLPAKYQQAMFLGIGAEEALRQRYQQPGLRVYSSNDPALRVMLDRPAAIPRPRDPQLAVFIYQDGQIFDRSTHLSNAQIEALRALR